MGYYTFFELTATPEPIDLAETFERICDFPITALDDTIKWYDSETNMLDLSRAYPNCYFDLYGDGEEHDDQWRAVFVNGHSHIVRARIIFDPIDIQSIDNIGQRCPELFL